MVQTRSFPESPPTARELPDWLRASFDRTFHGYHGSSIARKMNLPMPWEIKGISEEEWRARQRKENGCE